MKKSKYLLTVAELSTLYEISSLSLLEPENFSREITKKVIRLFGVRYFALFRGSGDNRQLVVSSGFKNTEDITKKINQNQPNQFHFDFGETGLLFMEKFRPLKDRERRIYTVFAWQLQQVIKRIIAVESLRKSEEKYRSLVEFASDPIYMVDRNCKYLSVNDTFLDRIGLPKDHVIGRTFGELHSQEETKIFTEKVNQVFETGDTIRYESYNKNLKRWAIRSLSPIKNSRTGEVITVSIIEKDITERKRAEEKLKASEKRFEDIARSSADWIWEVDANVKYTYASGRVEQILGYTPEELIGKSPFDMMPEEEVNRVRSIFQKIISEKKAIVDLENWNLSKKGERVYLLTNGVPVLDSNGNLIGYRGVDKDITERKKTEEKIKYLSFHDILTGLYNRNFFEEELKRLNTQRNFPLTIIIADVNGLKLINDTLGHAQGDELLKDLSRILKSVSRKEDIIARIGGDEFAIILPNCNENVARAFCNKFRNACKKFNSKSQIKLSVSLGYAIQTGKYKNIEMVLEQADKNMYAEKLLNNASREKHVIDTLRTVLAIRDPHTKEHAKRLQDLAESLGKDIGLSEFELKRLKLLALFHDIGKIGTPDNILFKRGKLTGKEWEIMKKHSEDGYKMAKNIPELFPITKDILYRHERWDGTGYPKGLKGKKIPILARIISIVDAYDAMLTNKTYRKAMTKEEAIKELKRCAGTQFDPELIKRFLKIISRRSKSQKMKESGPVK